MDNLFEILHINIHISEFRFIFSPSVLYMCYQKMSCSIFCDLIWNGPNFWDDTGIKIPWTLLFCSQYTRNQCALLFCTNRKWRTTCADGRWSNGRRNECWCQLNFKKPKQNFKDLFIYLFVCFLFWGIPGDVSPTSTIYFTFFPQWVAPQCSLCNAL